MATSLPSAIPTPATYFKDYDVYRATCTRYGFLSSPDDTQLKTIPSGSVVAGEVLRAMQEQCYMEFGTPTRVEHHLPDSYASLSDCSGLGVEVRIWVGILNGSTASAYYQIGNMALGWCERTTTGNIVPKERHFTHDDNLSIYELQYNVNKEACYTKWDNTAEWREYNRTGGSGISIGYCAVPSCYPAHTMDIVDAILSKALVLMNTLGGTDPNISTRMQIYADIIVGRMQGLVDEQTPNGYTSPYQPETARWTQLCGGSALSTVKNMETPSAVFYGRTIPTQQGATVTYYKSDNTQMHAVNVLGDTNTHTIPDDVLAEDDFKWTVLTTDSVGVTLQYPTLNCTTVDATPVVTPLSPVNTLVDASESAVFEWRYNITTDTSPTGYELQTQSGGQWTTLASKTNTAETSVEISAESLSTTMTAWRVRASNADGVFSDWSAAADVVLRLAPKVISVTATGTVRPLVEWRSADQQGYEVMVDAVTSGIQYGEVKSYQWPDILTDGVHTVRVRTINEYGLYSAWASTTFTASNTSPYASGAATAAQDGAADIKVTWVPQSAMIAQIYRDGEMVTEASATGGVWIDHRAVGTHSYFVRLVSASGDYTDLTATAATLRMKTAVIARDGVWDWHELSWLQGANVPTRTSQYAPVYALNYYSGSVLPQAEVSTYRSRTHAIRYTVQPDNAEIIRNFVGKMVVFKRKAELIEGMVTAVSETRSWDGETMSITITEVV